jgi:hypothetical protein
MHVNVYKVGRNGIYHFSYPCCYDFALLFGSCKELPTFPTQMGIKRFASVMVGNHCSLYNEAPATIDSGYIAWAPVYMSKTS